MDLLLSELHKSACIEISSKIHKIQKNSEKRESFCGIIGLDKCVYWRYFHYLCCLLPWENWNLNKTRMYTKDFGERCSSCSGKGKSAIIYFSKAIFRSNKTHWVSQQVLEFKKKFGQKKNRQIERGFALFYFDDFFLEKIC